MSFIIEGREGAARAAAFPKCVARATASTVSAVIDAGRLTLDDSGDRMSAQRALVGLTVAVRAITALRAILCHVTIICHLSA